MEWRNKTVEVANVAYDKNKKLVSVVIPYYNRATTIDETIESLRRQTYTNFEVTIVDDGSTQQASIDKLLDLNLEGLEARIVHQDNAGVAEARNNGISRSQGKYIVCLDSDDILDPTYLEKCVTVLETNPNIQVVSSYMRLFGVENAIYTEVPYDPVHIINNNMLTTAAMFERQAWEVSGGYKSGIGYEDWEFWISLAENGYWGYNITEPIFNYRTALMSRYVEDQLNKSANIKKINDLHPAFPEKVRKLYKQRKYVTKVLPKDSLFINLDDKEAYRQPKPKMGNILIASPWMTFGGAETLIYNYCVEVKDQFNISFVTGLRSDNEWEYKFKEITPNIYHLANLFTDKRLFMEFISNYVVTRQIDTLHIIHTDFVFEMLEELKRRHPQLRVIVTMFNDRVEHFGKSLHYKHLVDAFTSDNNQVYNHYRKELGEDTDIRVIPNGIDAYNHYSPELFDRQKERRNLGIDEEDLAVFFIGRLSPEKNPDVFLKVAEKIQSEQSSAKTRFFVIGDGIMKEEIEKTVKRIGSDRVTYLGYQQDPARYLGAADVFVLCSSIEGFPLSILEAMAMRVAVIASDVGAVSDVIENNVDGFVVSPASIDDIAAAVMTLSNDKNLLEKMKASSRLKVEKKYSNTILGKNYKKLYSDQLEK